MTTVTIPAELRSGVGTKASKLDRNNGLIPAVMYGNKKTPVHLNVKLQDIKSLIYTPDFKIAEINLNGSTYKCIVKATQFHAVTDVLNHIDFLVLEPGEKVNVSVPVRFKGTSPGVKLGGKLIQQIRKVTLKTTPENLIDEVRVDISGMELGSVVRIKNIEVPEGVTLMANPSNPVANIEIPRALKSAAAE
jgi:large subunit ribosomal protein L25